MDWKRTASAITALHSCSTADWNAPSSRRAVGAYEMGAIAVNCPMEVSHEGLLKR